MEQLNLSWFAAINADGNLHGYTLWLAIFAAKFVVFFVLLGLLGIWIWGTSIQRKTIVLAFCGCLFALFINWLIGLFWYHPRPFVLGIGHTYLSHAADSSFPSDHVSGLCALSFIFLWRRSLIGFLLLLITTWVAWARIYLGVHYPFDILGSIVVALVSTITVMYFSPVIEKYLVPKSRSRN